MVNKTLVITTNKTAKELTDQETILIKAEVASTEQTITEADQTEVATTNKRERDNHTDKTNKTITAIQKMKITTKALVDNSNKSNIMKSHITQKKKSKMRMRNI